MTIKVLTHPKSNALNKHFIFSTIQNWNHESTLKCEGL